MSRNRNRRHNTEILQTDRYNWKSMPFDFQGHMWRNIFHEISVLYLQHQTKCDNLITDT